jgi:hypothetical protein
MPKKAKRKGRKTNRAPPVYPAPPRKRWSQLSRVFAGAGTVATIIGGAAGVVTFLPRITVEASGPFDASPRPPVSFTIANINVIPLEDVRPLLGFCALSLNFGMPDAPSAPPPSFPRCTEKSSGFLTATNWHHSRIGMDEKFTATWDDAFHNQTPGSIDYADVMITVVYRPWFLPWQSQKTFRFVTRKLGDNKLYWFARPLKE